MAILLRHSLLNLLALGLVLLLINCHAQEEQAMPNAGGSDAATSKDASSMASSTCSAESFQDGSCHMIQTPGDNNIPVPFTHTTCQDDHDNCKAWADTGECNHNPKFMYAKCRRSCSTCDSDVKEPSPPQECQDRHEKCEQWANRKVSECEANPRYMHKSCKRSCGLCPDQLKSEEEIARGIQFGELQVLSEHGKNATEEALTRQLIQESIAYMQKVKAEGIVSPELFELCTNRHEKCSVWAVQGECEANPPYMKKKCAPACQTCDNLDFAKRCPPLDPNEAQPAWEPGDLNRMFEWLTQEPYLSQYQVEVLSRDPWVITMEDVIMEDEAVRLIELGAKEGYERSGGVGKTLADGSIESTKFGGRTSTNAWCHKNCANDPKAAQVLERLSNITHIPSNNSESLQLLRYEPGQFYRRHHDYIAENKNRQQGVRILTMYLYLNDVEAGGGTKFNALNITVMPKRGRALLWPSVLNEDPTKKDKRTDHEAMPVEAGIKYGANAWFHIYDYQTPHSKGCT